MPYTASLNNSLIDHWDGGSAFTQPSTVYLALYTAASGSDPSTWTEVSTSSTGYARIVVKGDFAAASASAAASNVANTFVPSTASWGTVVAATYISSSSGAGTIYGWFRLGDGDYHTAVALTTGVFYSAAHGFSDDDIIVFDPIFGESLPGGVTSGTAYYVISSATNNYSISTSQGGAAVTISSAGECQAQIYDPQTVNAANQNITFSSGTLTISHG